MSKLKCILVMVVALFSLSAANAQTAKQKGKTKNAKTVVNYQCPMKCEGDKTYHKNGKCPVCNMQMKPVQAAVIAYQCPMKCEDDKTYKKPGKCPVCKMDLTKLETKKAPDGHEGHNHN